VPTIATEPRIYDKLINHLKELDKPSFVDDLPKDLQLSDPGRVRMFNVAWAEGVIEFGHHDHSETALPLHANSSAAGQKICLLDSGMSWTGARSNKHCSIPEMLKRYDNLPECFRQTKVFDKSTKEYSVVREKVPGNPLRLQVRLTDKGWAMLAS